MTTELQRQAINRLGVPDTELADLISEKMGHTILPPYMVEEIRFRLVEGVDSLKNNKEIMETIGDDIFIVDTIESINAWAEKHPEVYKLGQLQVVAGWAAYLIFVRDKLLIRTDMKMVPEGEDMDTTSLLTINSNFLSWLMGVRAGYELAQKQEG